MKRQWMANHCYPYKMSAHDFINNLESSAEPFENNMINIDNDKPRYFEDWLKIYADWMEVKIEIEEGDTDPGPEDD
jgi:hypothetical protein